MQEETHILKTEGAEYRLTGDQAEAMLADWEERGWGIWNGEKIEAKNARLYRKPKAGILGLPARAEEVFFPKTPRWHCLKAFLETHLAQLRKEDMVVDTAMIDTAAEILGSYDADLVAEFIRKDYPTLKEYSGIRGKYATRPDAKGCGKCEDGWLVLEPENKGEAPRMAPCSCRPKVAETLRQHRASGGY